MEIKEVDISKIKQIYENHMVNDFPAAELKPFKFIESLISKHNYQCCALYSQGSIVAYAFFCFNNLQTCFLLDYFAVIATKRGRGYGSQFLTLLKEKFCDIDGFLVEVEKVESAEKEQERKQRAKRIHFYLQNGMSRTSVSTNLLGVNFNILYQPLRKSRDDDYIYTVLKEIYSFMYPEQLSDRIKKGVCHMVDNTMQLVAEKLSPLLFIEGIVLGGSRARGTHTEDSDIDIGIYYKAESFDLTAINQLATELDDEHRNSLVVSPGSWGDWVNGGGWLIINGYHVDLILRDIKRVEQVMKDTEQAKYRTVIHLFYYESYSIKDISGLTGYKESTVRSHLTRARQKLKSVLKEADYESL